MASTKNIPIDVVHLLPLLDQKLIELLKSLSPDEWQKQTIAKLWKVKSRANDSFCDGVRNLSYNRKIIELRF